MLRVVVATLNRYEKFKINSHPYDLIEFYNYVFGVFKRMLSKLIHTAPTPMTKKRYNTLKKIKKSRLKMAKFAKRENCFVYSGGYSRCVDCGRTRANYFVCCDVCIVDGLKLDESQIAPIKGALEYGVFINTGKININRLKPAIQEGQFVSLAEFRNLVAQGQRFMDLYGELLGNVDVFTEQNNQAGKA